MLTSRTELIVKRLNSEQRKLKSALVNLRMSLNRPILAMRQHERYANKMREIIS